jgi:hypothetical protein
MNRSPTTGHKVTMGVSPEPASLRGRRWLKVGGLTAGLLMASALVFLAPILWLTWLDPFGGLPHPSDSRLIAQFARHRGELEQVAAMAREDEKLRRLAPTFMRPEAPADADLGGERIEAYRRLLARAGIAHGILNGDNEIWFLVSTRGLSISGSAKGFIRCEQPAPDARIVTTDLDREPVPPRGELVMRHIEGPWWLMLDTR